MTIKSDLEFSRKNNLIEEIVMISAIGRSGKGMLANVLSSFNRIEKLHFLDIFESIGILWQYGKISKDAAISLLKIEGDKHLYNSFIGRDMNFRPTDASSIFNNSDPGKYIKRLFNDAEVVEEIVREKPIMQASLHDGIRYSELYFDTFGEKLKMVHIIRDPVETVYSWQKGDFGERIGHDLREFQLTVCRGEEVVPHDAVGWEDEYLSIKPIDRVIALINSIYESNIRSYEKLHLREKNRIMLVDFEEFVSEPMPLCFKIANFLGTTTTGSTEKILKAENCPRVISKEDINQKKAEIEKGASPKYIKVFRELIQKHESYFKKRLL